MRASSITAPNTPGSNDEKTSKRRRNRAPINPARGVTIPKILARSMTAEIAIPWFAFDTDDLGGMQINLCRNLATAEGAIAWHTLRPGSTGGFHDFTNFGAVSGLGGFRPVADFFAPRVVSATVTGVRKHEGAKVYDLKVALDKATPVTGKVDLAVLEDFGDGAKETLKKSVNVTGAVELELGVPAGDLTARSVRVVLRNPVGGGLLAERVVGSLDLAGGVISKDSQPFYRKDGASAVRSATLSSSSSAWR